MTNEPVTPFLFHSVFTPFSFHFHSIYSAKMEFKRNEKSHSFFILFLTPFHQILWNKTRQNGVGLMNLTLGYEQNLRTLISTYAKSNTRSDKFSNLRGPPPLNPAIDYFRFGLRGVRRNNRKVRECCCCGGSRFTHSFGTGNRRGGEKERGRERGRER